LCAWIFAGAAASPLYFFAEVAFLRLRSVEKVHKLCIAKWPNSDVARWYGLFIRKQFWNQECPCC